MHIPVMYLEVANFLNIKKNGIYVDATFGFGGHTKIILKKLLNGKIYVFDKDYFSFMIASELAIKDGRILAFHSSFENIHDIVLKYSLLNKVDGIIVDLGLSSFQLGDASRGFSFMKNGFIDMRMDNRQKFNAFYWINHASFDEITNILLTYGEERYAKKIAYNVVLFRKNTFIRTTNDLVKIIYDSIPFKNYRIHPATRVFQAIRILINDELNVLKKFMNYAVKILSLHGRLIVISFNSLEDRIIKNFVSYFNDYNLKIKLAVKFIKPSIFEINSNNKSRSSIMRVIERIS